MTTQAAAHPEPPAGVNGLVDALTGLRHVLAEVRFPLALPGADGARHAAAGMAGQLDDYVLPRLARLDAPVLVVVGGSTGAGKSTLVNSLVRSPVSEAGVLRPTTRAPVLVCHLDDAAWFTGPNLLPHLGRTLGRALGPTRARPPSDGDLLRVVESSALRPGLALLDAPDIDSVVEANRAFAEQLLAAADLWLFVTSAARYADAVPWQVLRTARERGTAIALILDRVPGAAADEIAPHLLEMLARHNLGEAPLFVLPEARLDAQGLLAEATVASLRDWLGFLAASAAARGAVVRQTMDGAIGALAAGVAELADAGDEQAAGARALAAAVQTAYAGAEAAVEQGVRDGQILHGEVLARWQELVGTGEFMRGLQARIGRLRDRVTAAVTGRTASTDQLTVALESGLVALVRGAVADAAEEAAAAWQAHPAGVPLLAGDPHLHAAAEDLTSRAERMVRDWQRGVLELVRAEAGNKRFVARAGAYAVNALGLVVMVAVFTATSFIPTGAEVVVAGGTTVAAQKVLEAIFGDQAVRQLAELARVDLLRRIRELLAGEANRFRTVLDATGLDLDTPARLRRASAAVQSARAAAALANGSGILRPTGDAMGWRP